MFAILAAVHVLSLILRTRIGLISDSCLLRWDPLFTLHASLPPLVSAPQLAFLAMLDSNLIRMPQWQLQAYRPHSSFQWQHHDCLPSTQAIASRSPLSASRQGYRHQDPWLTQDH